ncbi:hypothetical protein CFN78_25525 [Amycolatopsis antarctica]|uniref:Uncharacterized protein n=1 Tax=Amycolatopsis antarctica TaxID=1854586 RepID=A0A263CVY9_9PSEU|nr:hypothetical protein CFN78_25525 [Amycolatopsis antarctica]
MDDVAVAATADLFDRIALIVCDTVQRVADLILWPGPRHPSTFLHGGYQFDGTHVFVWMLTQNL